MNIVYNNPHEAPYRGREFLEKTLAAVERQERGLGSRGMIDESGLLCALGAFCYEHKPAFREFVTSVRRNFELPVGDLLPKPWFDAINFIPLDTYSTVTTINDQGTQGMTPAERREHVMAKLKEAIATFETPSPSETGPPEQTV